MKFHHLTKDLQRSIADLDSVNPWFGLARFSILGAVLLGWVAIAWTAQNPALFLLATLLAAIAYAFWLICTHDMVHHTLTGWKWFDRWVPYIISYPMMWPHGLYAELHLLHHRWNGTNLKDPERVQWTWEHYQQAHPLIQWYVRHQWLIDVWVFAGLGLIIKTLVHGWQLRSHNPRILRNLLIDLTGILLVQGLVLAIVIPRGEGLRYLAVWLLLERMIGGILQTRDHLEHYALWGKAANHQMTQLYTARNIQASALVSWLMGGLNYHAIHHAFPSIPFHHLPEAFDRVQAVLLQHQQAPLILESGYLQATLWLQQHPSVIGEEMVPIVRQSTDQVSLV